MCEPNPDAKPDSLIVLNKVAEMTVYPSCLKENNQFRKPTYDTNTLSLLTKIKSGKKICHDHKGEQFMSIKMIL